MNNIDVISRLIFLLSKTIKGDTELTFQILCNGLSTFTKNPTHLMIMEKSSEGKTYPALEIAKYFPKKSVITIGSVTPQAFKYEYGIEVDEKYQPIQEQLDKLDDRIRKIKKDKEKGHDSIDYLETRKKNLQKQAIHLVDLRGKWIIFKEPPDHKLLEALYSTLSSDEEFNEHRFVNRVGGTNQTFKVVIRGTPAILVCSARDETKNTRWDETFTRFNVISPVSNPKKYREGMELIGKTFGLPRSLYAEVVISPQEQNECVSLIEQLVQQIQAQNGEIINPFVDELGKQFPQEAGFRWRQYTRFLGFVRMHCLCNLDERPKAIMNDQAIPFATLDDIKFGLSLVKDNVALPPNKIEWFKRTFVPCWEEYGIDVLFKNSGQTRKCIIGKDLKEFAEAKTKARLTVKHIREVYLETLFEHGIVEKDADPRNKTRDVYWPAESIDNIEASSLFAVSSLDEPCVKSFLDRYLKRRFEYEIDDKSITEDELIQYILSNQNVVDSTKNEYKIDNDDMTLNKVRGGERL